MYELVRDLALWTGAAGLVSSPVALAGCTPARKAKPSVASAPGAIKVSFITGGKGELGESAVATKRDDAVVEKALGGSHHQTLLFERTDGLMRSRAQRACACGRHYDIEAWAALPLITRLTADDVAALVSSWPAHVVIEVRACARCSRQCSRLVERNEAIAA
ncbi:hypothetical protein AKJ09_00501 [Labilithrix luteola]|uniref:Uncharacterized protein n=1 Tax=Labilithrix luteola TaxID=1391654 RepID=A0A0K1PJZ5_9BACT|nr:hypothetical protein [Labilithrix luteola]AKU93837.1 hypothetical protein AKJ09_00501 [Labilithrix luteola]